MSVIYQLYPHGVACKTGRGYTDGMKKDTLTIIGVALVAIVIGIIAFVYGNNTQNSSVVTTQSSAAVVPFTELVQGTQSTIEKRVNYFITSSTELNKLWEMIGANGTPPKVDFRTQAVIAVFAGKESTSSIAVARVEDTSARLVSIAITKPDKTCTVEQPAASPYEVVVVPTTELPLAHEDIVTTADCPK